MSPREAALANIRKIIASGEEFSGSLQVHARLRDATSAQLRSVAAAETFAEVKVVLFPTRRRR